MDVSGNFTYIFSDDPWRGRRILREERHGRQASERFPGIRRRRDGSRFRVVFVAAGD